MFAFLLLLPAAFGADFQTTALEAARRCRFEKAVCSAPYAAKLLSREANARLFARLDQKARELSNTWGDTILEGDYHAFGGTKASTALAILSGRKLVAYQLEYYEEAIETSDKECVRDDDWSFTGKCKVGRIYEVRFVSPDLRQDAADDGRYATFFASPREKEEVGYKKDR